MISIGYRFIKPRNSHHHRLLYRKYVSFELSSLWDEEDETTHVVGDEKLPRVRFVNGRYLSPWSRETNKDMWSVMTWMMNGDPDTAETRDLFADVVTTDSRELIKCATVDHTSVNSIGTNHITWIGHATCLMHVDGMRILTDPMFSTYASAIQGLGPKRYMPPALEVEELPPVDVVLLSHTHYDHLDAGSAKRLGNAPLWIVPLGVKQSLENFGINNVVELDWWQTCTMEIEKKSGNGAATLEATLTPAKHWTARSPFDKNTGLWGSFCVHSVTSGVRIFFGGDSAYCDVFKQIGERHGPFDLALLPIGAYKPRWFMKDVHCSPEEAVYMHTDLGAKQTLGVHWGTFHLADEDYIEPALDLARARTAAGLTSRDVFTLRHGDTLIFGDSPGEKDFAEAYPMLVERYSQFHGNRSVEHESERKP